MTLYFPPAGGGGVQRPLKFASHLPALGIETHVLAFLRTGDLSIPRRYHAGWLVLRRGEPARPGARTVYRDARFLVLRL